MFKKTATAQAVKEIIWQPLPKQALALGCPVEDILFGGAVGGGKTDFLIAAFVKHAAEYAEDAIGLIVRRTLPELRDIEKRCRRTLARLGWTYEVGKRTWTAPNGASLLLGYLETMEDANRYYGQEYTFFGVDEAGHYKSPEPIDLLRSRLRGGKNPDMRRPLILTANPGGKGHQWLVERYIKPAAPYTPHKDPDTGLYRVYIPSRLTDNPYLMKDENYVRRIKGSGPKWLVKALLMGDWSISINGKVFPRENWRTYKHPPVFDFVFQSWDFAAKLDERNDRSVCITIGIKYGIGAFVIDCYAGKLELPDQVKKVKELATKFKVSTVLIEDASNGIGVVQTVKRETSLGVIPIQAKGRKEDRIIQASVLVEAGRVFIPEAADWLEDFLLETGGFPELAHDDIPDALAQAINYLAARYTFIDDLRGYYDTVAGPTTKQDKPTNPNAHFNSHEPADAGGGYEEAEQSTW